MGLINFSINGKSMSGAEGETILKVAQRSGIPVPTLCHHEAVEDSGACRLCMVEITHDDWGGWKGLVTACLYPIEPGLHVATESPDVIECRKSVLDLLLARCPGSEVIRDLAAQHGLETTSYTEEKKADDCILCALCTRICSAMGHHAISTIHRGAKKKIGIPLGQPPDTCVGCAVCAKICPTNVIQYDEVKGTRKIWGKKFEMLSCSGCGKAYITRAQAEFICRREGLTIDYFEKCDDCRRVETADSFSRMVKW